MLQYLARYGKVMVFSLASMVWLGFTSAYACDPNESCNRCLVHNPFGGCVQYGNDPVCEARKAACPHRSEPSGIPVDGAAGAFPVEPCSKNPNLPQCADN